MFNNPPPESHDNLCILIKEPDFFFLGGEGAHHFFDFLTYEFSLRMLIFVYYYYLILLYLSTLKSCKLLRDDNLIYTVSEHALKRTAG